MHPSTAPLLVSACMLALASGAPFAVRAATAAQCGTTKAATAFDLVFSDGQQFASQQGVDDFCTFLSQQDLTVGSGPSGPGPLQVNTSVATPASGVTPSVVLSLELLPKLSTQNRVKSSACNSASACSGIMGPLFANCVSNFTSGAFAGTTIATSAFADDAGCGRFSYTLFL